MSNAAALLTRTTPPVDSAGARPGTAAAPPAHPFAAFLRTIGRGPTLSRPLDGDEAAEAMGMVLAGAVEPVQLGAFLLVLRYRTETPAELAGFVRAARASLGRAVDGGDIGVELDWPSYADRHRQLPYFILAALLLAGQGVRVVMHGIGGEGPATTPRALAALGVTPCASAGEVGRRLDADGFAYVPLGVLSPPVERLFGLRPLLGVRSPANTFARALNPFRAPCQIQGVFHPTYLPLHQETARLLGQPRAAIFKGGGGEAQRNPEKPCRVATVIDGAAGDEAWPALTPGDAHPWRKEELEPARLAAIWRGDDEPPGPVAAVVGTAAVALHLLGRAATREDAEAQAQALWRGRPKRRYPSP